MSIEKLYESVVHLVEDIPFGNSDLQNRMVIVNDEKTPCRAARHAGLRIMNRIEALRENYYSLRKNDIEIRMLERDKANVRDDLQKELLQLEIERRLSGMRYTKKLIKDAIREIEVLIPVLDAVGKITREQFEKEEREHYRLKHPDIEVPPEDCDLYARITKELKEAPLLEATKLLEDG